eukprot:1605631-Pyramimonas_sp.AAC.1
MGTPIKRQSSMSSLWGLSSNPVESPSSRKKLRSSPCLSPEAKAMFLKELEAKRLEADKSEEGRLAAAAERRAKASTEGKVLDPDDIGRGVARGPKKGGRPEGSSRKCHGTHKPRAAPTLRRDPPAQCKLQIALDWCKQADKQELADFSQPPVGVKTQLTE